MATSLQGQVPLVRMPRPTLQPCHVIFSSPGLFITSPHPQLLETTRARTLKATQAGNNLDYQDQLLDLAVPPALISNTDNGMHSPSGQGASNCLNSVNSVTSPSEVEISASVVCQNTWYQNSNLTSAQDDWCQNSVSSDVPNKWSPKCRCIGHNSAKYYNPVRSNWVSDSSHVSFMSDWSSIQPAERGEDVLLNCPAPRKQLHTGARISFNRKHHTRDVPRCVEVYKRNTSEIVTSPSVTEVSEMKVGDLQNKNDEETKSLIESPITPGIDEERKKIESGVSSPKVILRFKDIHGGLGQAAIGTYIDEPESPSGHTLLNISHTLLPTPKKVRKNSPAIRTFNFVTPQKVKKVTEGEDFLNEEDIDLPPLMSTQTAEEADLTGSGLNENDMKTDVPVCKTTNSSEYLRVSPVRLSNVIGHAFQSLHNEMSGIEDAYYEGDASSKCKENSFAKSIGVAFQETPFRNERQRDVLQGRPFQVVGRELKNEIPTDLGISHGQLELVQGGHSNGKKRDVSSTDGMERMDSSITASWNTTSEVESPEADAKLLPSETMPLEINASFPEDLTTGEGGNMTANEGIPSASVVYDPANGDISSVAENTIKQEKFPALPSPLSKGEESSCIESETAALVRSLMASDIKETEKMLKPCGFSETCHSSSVNDGDNIGPNIPEIGEFDDEIWEAAEGKTSGEDIASISFDIAEDLWTVETEDEISDTLECKMLSECDILNALGAEHIFENDQTRIGRIKENDSKEITQVNLDSCIEAHEYLDSLIRGSSIPEEVSKTTVHISENEDLINLSSSERTTPNMKVWYSKRKLYSRSSDLDRAYPKQSRRELDFGVSKDSESRIDEPARVISCSELDTEKRQTLTQPQCDCVPQSQESLNEEGPLTSSFVFLENSMDESMPFRSQFLRDTLPSSTLTFTPLGPTESSLLSNDNDVSINGSEGFENSGQKYFSDSDTNCVGQAVPSLPIKPAKEKLPCIGTRFNSNKHIPTNIGSSENPTRNKEKQEFDNTKISKEENGCPIVMGYTGRRRKRQKRVMMFLQLEEMVGMKGEPMVYSVPNIPVIPPTLKVGDINREPSNTNSDGIEKHNHDLGDGVDSLGPIKQKPQHFPLKCLIVGTFKHNHPVDLPEKCALFKVYFGKRRLVYEFLALDKDGKPRHSSIGCCQQFIVEVMFEDVVELYGCNEYLRIRVSKNPKVRLSDIGQPGEEPRATNDRPCKKRTIDITGGQLTKAWTHEIILSTPSAENICQTLGDFDQHLKTVIKSPKKESLKKATCSDWPSKLISNQLLSTVRSEEPSQPSSRSEYPGPQCLVRLHGENDGEKSKLCKTKHSKYSCRCVLGCKVQRCRCRRSRRFCNKDCACNLKMQCNTMLQNMKMFNLSTDALETNLCLYDNIEKKNVIERALGDRENMRLPCCKRELPFINLAQDITCSFCGVTFKYSWCTGAFHSNHEDKRNHCVKCRMCMDPKHNHCNDMKIECPCCELCSKYIPGRSLFPIQPTSQTDQQDDVTTQTNASHKNFDTTKPATDICTKVSDRALSKKPYASVLKLGPSVQVSNNMKKDVIKLVSEISGKEQTKRKADKRRLNKKRAQGPSDGVVSSRHPLMAPGTVSNEEVLSVPCVSENAAVNAILERSLEFDIKKEKRKQTPVNEGKMKPKSQKIRSLKKGNPKISRVSKGGRKLLIDGGAVCPLFCNTGPVKVQATGIETYSRTVSNEPSSPSYHHSQLNTPEYFGSSNENLARSFDAPMPGLTSLFTDIDNYNTSDMESFLPSGFMGSPSWEMLSSNFNLNLDGPSSLDDQPQSLEPLEHPNLEHHSKETPLSSTSQAYGLDTDFFSPSKMLM